MNKFLLGFGLSFLFSQALQAGAACCAAKGDLPSLITDHSQNQFSLSIAGSSVIGSSDKQGNSEFFHSEKYDRSLTIGGSAATKITHDIQFGVSFPFVIKSSRDLNRRANSKGIGDPSLSLAYELIGHHHHALPQTFLTFSLGIPAGEAPEESDLAIIDAATGSGHWSLQAGALTMQNWANWAGSFQTFAQYSVPQDFETPVQKVTLEPGWIIAAKLRGGRSFWSQKFYLGLGLGPKWQQAQKRKDVFGSSRKGYRLAWDAGVDASLNLMEELSVVMAYSDQTLLGPTRRSSLSRTLSLSFQVKK